MEDLNVAIRLKGFIDSEGLTHSQFADRCGIPRPSLSQLLSGRNKKISDVLIGQIHKAFPDLSVLWLLFGEGPMKDISGGSSSGFNSDGCQMDSSEGFVPPVNADGVYGFGGDCGGAGAENGAGSVENSENSISAHFSGPDNPGFVPNGPGMRKFSNVSGLNIPSNITQSLENKQEELSLKLSELQKQIEKMKRNPRKVSHITVYYDDSTFETFYPKG